MEGGEEQRKGATAGDQTEREGPPWHLCSHGLGGGAAQGLLGPAGAAPTAGARQCVHGASPG